MANIRSNGQGKRTSRKSSAPEQLNTTEEDLSRDPLILQYIVTRNQSSLDRERVKDYAFLSKLEGPAE